MNSVTALMTPAVFALDACWTSTCTVIIAVHEYEYIHRIQLVDNQFQLVADMYTLHTAPSIWHHTPTHRCDTLLDTMHTTIGHVNVYDLYEPCVMSMRQQRAPGQSRSLRRAIDAGLGGPDGCINAGVRCASFWQIFTLEDVIGSPRLLG
jgi:hypothetical protein